jgi:Spy/CpxP family protein refolding chaperone
MKQSLTYICLFLAAVAVSASDAHPQSSHHSAYAGETKSDVPSLSAEEVSQLESGAGMGLARAAELNGYPGPMHVLEAAEELGLSEAQREETQRIFEVMKSDAVRIGKEILEKERHLSMRFQHRHIDEKVLRELVTEVGLLRAELRVAHLRAHLSVAALLTPEQIERYDELRGYSRDAKSSHQHH